MMSQTFAYSSHNHTSSCLKVPPTQSRFILGCVRCLDSYLPKTRKSNLNYVRYVAHDVRCAANEVGGFFSSVKTSVFINSCLAFGKLL